MKRLYQLILLIFPCMLQQSCSTRPLRTEVFKAFEDKVGPTEFAPELALADNTYKGSFSGDFSSFYFFRHTQPNLEDYRLFESKFKEGKWSEPRMLFTDTSSDLYPVVSTVDPRKLIFTSYRRTPHDTSRRPNANFWQVEKRGEDWGRPSPVESANLIYNYNSQPCMTERGDIYFTSNLPDWSAAYTYKMTLNGATYGQPEKFDFVNNLRLTDTSRHYWEICMAPDESYMIMVVSKGSEVPKLYITGKEGMSWTNPAYLGDILHTDMSGNFPYITRDGKFLIFTRAFSRFYILPTKIILKVLR